MISLRSGVPSPRESSLSTASKKSSRSSSPVKKKADLKLGRIELDYKGSIQNGEDDLPEDVHYLCERLEIICHGVGVIPTEVKHLFERKEKLHHHMVGIERSQGDYAELADEFTAVETILRKSLDCLRREKHEPAWNEEVHRPVLDLAFKTWQKADVSIDNVYEPSLIMA